jgi:hypothetical protein
MEATGIGRDHRHIRSRERVSGLPWFLAAVAAIGVVVADGGGTPRPASEEGGLKPAPQETAPGQSVVRDSDLEDFWTTVTSYAPTSFHYESLDAIVADSHLILRGKLVGVTEGRVAPFDLGLSDLPVVFTLVQVEEVLKGVAESREPGGAVLVARFARAGTSESELPKDEVILFLKNYARMRVDFGASPAGDADDRYYYARPNAYQAVLVNRDGTLFAPPAPPEWGYAYGPFPGDLNGLAFADVAELIEGSIVTVGD